jgi:hypothetical protein
MRRLAYGEGDLRGAYAPTESPRRMVEWTGVIENG